MEGLTEGRIVHYVLEEGPHASEHRPAIVVKVWDKAAGYVNLLVFVDGTNDGANYAGCLRWVTSVMPSDGCQPRTWHWIEKA